MKRGLLAIVGLVFVIGLGHPAPGLFMAPDIEKVPIDRVIKNLKKAVKEDPKNARARVNLARAEAMAYASKADQVEVNRGELWFGFTPKYVPFQVKPSDDKKVMEKAKQHLDNAVVEYQEAVKLDGTNLAARLGLAWALDQADKDDEAIKEYRAVIAEAWKTEKDLDVGRMGGNYLSAEAIGYLVPLLDAKKDAKEVADLNSRKEKLQKLPRPVTPIAIPLRDGLSAADLENRDAQVRFDADGKALDSQWSWVNKDAGWLVYDPKQTGKIESGLQLFGNVTFWMFWSNGYEALGSLDDNRDGKITGDELIGLSIWQDLNGNGISDKGEVRPVSDWGIVELSCQYTIDANHPDRIAFSKDGVRFHDGTRRSSFDLVLHSK